MSYCLDLIAILIVLTKMKAFGISGFYLLSFPHLGRSQWAGGVPSWPRLVNINVTAPPWIYLWWASRAKILSSPSDRLSLCWLVHDHSIILENSLPTGLTDFLLKFYLSPKWKNSKCKILLMTIICQIQPWILVNVKIL